MQEDMQAAIAHSAAAADITSPLDTSTAGVFDEDWEASVRASYKPLQMADGLWIVPDWCAAASGTPGGLDAVDGDNSEDNLRCIKAVATLSCRCEAPDDCKLCVFLHPGVAFGTGSHATTRMCLKWLQHSLQHGQTVLDYGCGSGILAIVACKLGASCAVRSP